MGQIMQLSETVDKTLGYRQAYMVSPFIQVNQYWNNPPRSEFLRLLVIQDRYLLFHHWMLSISYL